MRQHYSFYDPATGLFTGKGFTGSEVALALNTPAGTVSMPGQFDPLSQMVVDGAVVYYQPPQPGPDYMWDDVARRWQLSDAAQAALVVEEAAKAELEDIDAKSIRAMREMLVGDPDALGRLQQLDEQANIQRGELMEAQATIAIDVNT